MDEIYGFPLSNSEDNYPYYTHDHVAPLKDANEYEASPWFSTSSGTVSMSAASSYDHDPTTNTRNSIPKGGSSSLQVESCSANIRAKISSHPLYPKLLEAYIDCQKVGAPPEMANLLDKILQETNVARSTTRVPYCFGKDPELDEFMETYCGMLAKFKLDLARPYNAATTFLSDIESQLSNLCNNAARVLGDEDEVSSDDDTSSAEIEEEQQQCNRRGEDGVTKEELLRKYSGCISSLRHEFSKKKKKGKLPSDARQILLNWWTIHYNWPYPTEAEKVALAESTGLDQKQINNWFINQRKRHWKPSDHNLKPIFVNNLSGSFFPE